MERRLSIWLALCLLCLCGTALGEETTAEYAKVRGMNIMELTAGLTEIYGYTQEEADQFLCSVTETESTLEYVLYPAEHPNWRYTHVLNRKNGACEDDLSPFSGTNLPGYEGWLRAILQRAAEESWFENWDEAAMTALYDQMTQWEFRRSARLEAGLGQKNLTAAETVQELFVSTFGDELSWTEPVREWRDEVLAQHGLNRETVSTAPVQGVQRWQAEGPITGKMTVVEFAGQLPEELQSLYVNEPHLAGWNCLSGAMRLPETAGRSALMAFGRGEERLLAKEWYEQQLANYPDVLTVAQVCEVTGYQRHTILKWCSKGLLKTILQTPKYMIPKVWLLEFVASDFFNEISRKCGKHYAAIKEISSSRKAR